MGTFPNKETQFSSKNQPEGRGRPRKLPNLDLLLAEILGSEAIEGADTDIQSAAARIIDSLRKMAEKGNVRAAEILLDRMYGKPKQDIKIENPVAHQLIITEEIIQRTENKEIGNADQG